MASEQSVHVTHGKVFRSIQEVEREFLPVTHASRQRGCPTCGAEPGAPCVAVHERMALVGVHPERVAAERKARA